VNGRLAARQPHSSATIDAERAVQLAILSRCLKAISFSFPVAAFVSSCIEICTVQGLANLESEEAEGIDVDQCEVFKVR
jgi:hypothetical protein